MRAGWHVILTQRPETMPSHPGQIAFPGGKAEEGETIAQTALRETEEEIGVGAADVELLGRLPSFDAVSQFRITPFVGIVAPSAVIKPDPREVESVFEVPLAFLMNPSITCVEMSFSMNVRMFFTICLMTSLMERIEIFGV